MFLNIIEDGGGHEDDDNDGEFEETNLGEEEDNSSGQEIEEEGEDNSGEEGEGGEASSTIPKARFNEVIDQRNDLRDENKVLRDKIQELEGQGGEDDQLPDVDELEDQYIQAISDGDTAKAKSIRKEIREVERAQLKKEMETADSAATNQVLEVQRVREMVTQAEKDYGFLNEKDASYDAEAVDDLLDLQKAYIAKGDTPSKAFEKALNKAVKLYGPADTGTEMQGDDDGKSQKNLKEKAEMAAGQPPKSGGKNNSDTETKESRKVMDMSDEDFENLSDQELAELRGDVITKNNSDMSRLQEVD